MSVFALSSKSCSKSSSLKSQEQVRYSVMDRLHRSSRAHYKVKYNWGEKQTLQELQMQFAVTITAEHHFVSKRCVFLPMAMSI